MRRSRLMVCTIPKLAPATRNRARDRAIDRAVCSSGKHQDGVTEAATTIAFTGAPHRAVAESSCRPRRVRGFFQCLQPFDGGSPLLLSRRLDGPRRLQRLQNDVLGALEPATPQPLVDERFGLQLDDLNSHGAAALSLSSVKS